MTVLVCHNHYALRAGEDDAVAAEITLLRARGHRVVVYTRDNAEIARWPLARKLGLVVGAFYQRGVMREVRALVERERPDVAHVHNVFPLLSPGIVMALWKAGVPVVYTAHNFRTVCANGLLFRDGRPCHACLEWRYWSCVWHRCFRGSRVMSLWYAAIICWHRWRRTWQRHVQRVIALNEYSRELLVRSGFAEEQVVVLPNFAELGEPDEEAGALGEKTTVDGPYLLFAGRLADEKGIMTVVAAAAAVPEARVWIAGNGPREEAVRAAVAEKNLNNVKLLGRVDAAELRRIVRSALALIFASECYENCPLVVITALWQGTPVITSRTGGMPSFVPEGRAGWHFTPGASAELAEKMRWVWEHQEEVRAMRAHVRAWGREQFNAERHAQGLERVYEEVIRDVRGRSVCA